MSEQTSKTPDTRLAEVRARLDALTPAHVAALAASVRSADLLFGRSARANEALTLLTALEALRT